MIKQNDIERIVQLVVKYTSVDDHEGAVRTVREFLEDKAFLQPKRLAQIDSGATAPTVEQVQDYLPHNYKAFFSAGDIWVEGYDDAGWTLDGYVLPRLASGLIFAKEVK